MPVNRRLDHLRRDLQQAVAAILGMRDLPDLRTGFADMGMDSLMALELKRQLESRLESTLPATLAFEYPTVDALADHLLNMVMQLAEGNTAATARGDISQLAPAPAISTNEPIAVVGIGCRFPGADTPEAFWQLLQQGVDTVGEVPALRWDVDAYYDPQRPMPGKSYTRLAAFVDGVDQFDPIFFGISPREAVGMDPQQRLLLEVTWEALERAGLAPEQLVDSPTGVFVGIGSSDYGALAGVQDYTTLDTHAATSSGHSIAAGRLAYTLGLQGPTLAVDTACSSSLVALHLACQSLRAGECTVALAGGVSLMLSAVGHVALSQMQALSPDGRCKTFDAAADGYGRGEGGSMVVLKRLSDAVAAGDAVLAVIKGSAVNHDGPSSGLTVPNKRAQEKLLRQALANAQVTPQEISYIEAHGTGTPLGDPIEVRALGAVFGADRAQPLLVGSVKTNVGHLEAAAGIAGFVKTVLALHYGQIPPHLHFQTPNPYIEWDEFAIDVPTKLQPWPVPSEGHIPVAGVSSFGISGTNAHIVLAAAPNGDAGQPAQTAAPRRAQLLPLSAKNGAAVAALAARYRDYLTLHPDLDLGDLSYTATTGRNHFAQRLALVAESTTDLVDKLSGVCNGAETTGVIQGTVSKQRPRIAFLFTGQGSQYEGMGRDLYVTEPIFRSVLDRCEAVAQVHLGRSLLDLFYPERTQDAEGEIAQTTDLLDDHPCGQAANFALECALVELWRSWGVQPDVVLGHSLGDFAAAYAAGVLDLEAGLELVIKRGQLMATAHGAMWAVMASEAEMQPFVAAHADVAIGVINGPQSVVLSGSHVSMTEIAEMVQAAGFKLRKLAIPMAAHSPLLDPVLDEFEAAVCRVTLRSPQLTVISSMTGQPVTAELTDPRYWRQHLRNTVRFADGVATLHAQGIDICIEIGPKPTLLGMAEGVFDKMTSTSSVTGREPYGRGHPVIRSSGHPVMLPSLRESQNDTQQMLTSLGELYVRGVVIDWQGVHGQAQGKRHKHITLPTYPFQRERYWIDRTPQQRRQNTLRPLVDKLLRLPLQNQTVAESEFSLETLPFLADHLVFGAVVSPGACQVALVLNAAAERNRQHAACTLSEVILPQPLVIPAGDDAAGARTVQAIFTPEQANGHGPQTAFKVISFDPQAFTADTTSEPATHAVGTLLTVQEKLPMVDLAALQDRCAQDCRSEIGAFYNNLAQTEIALGPSFQWLTGLWRPEQTTDDEQPAEALAQINRPAAVAPTTGYQLHPGLLDACFQVAALTRGDATFGEAMLPFAIDALHLHQPAAGEEWWCHAVQVAPLQWDIQLLDQAGQLLVAIERFEVRLADADAVRGHDRWKDWLYQIEWQEQPSMGLSPDYLPAPATVGAALEGTLPALLAAHGWERHQQASDALEAVAIDYVLAALAKAGFTFEVGRIWQRETLAHRLGVIPHYHRLLQRLLDMLVDVGILQHEGAGWQVLKTPERQDPAIGLQTIRVDHTGTIDAAVALLARCGDKLSEVLRGVQEPLELLFPGGATTLTRRLYTETATAQVMNNLLAQALQQAVATLPAHQSVRIVEIGAGSGSTTEVLLPLLPEERTEYLFTDIGTAFLTKAQETFGDYPFMHYQLLDIEQPLADQGVALQQADIVIAANVLHATQDLNQSLTHVRQLLKPGGVLLLLENTRPTRFADLTFGLTDGWWRFADDRQAHPLVDEATWQELLNSNGFTGVAAVGGQTVGQSILVAQADQTSLALQRPWLLFADRTGVATALADRLRQQGDRPILVHAGDSRQRLNAQSYQIDPSKAADYQWLLSEAMGDAPLTGVVHLWSLSDMDLTNTDPIAATQRSTGTVLHLTQALLQQGVEPENLWLITQQAQAVQPADPVTGAAHAPLWGIGKVIALEHPELHCRRLDLAAGEADTLAAQLHTELTTQPLDGVVEDQVAFRQQRRFVPRLARFVSQSSTIPHCDPAATYLITGGLGGLGLAVAEWLAAQGAKQLLLIGRSRPTAAAEEQIAALGAQGITVTTAQVDVTNLAQLRETLAQIDENRPLRGIIHAVGVLDDGALLQQNWERFARALAPKIHGAWHLHTLTKGCRSISLCSSHRARCARQTWASQPCGGQRLPRMPLPTTAVRRDCRH
ncbi:MAG: SDR family NAD(P)-dependent oxidoreductase [Caldilineaceae bacterium]